MTELIIGTAQFGSGYGVTNAVGRLGAAEVQGVIDVALENGIRSFDTSPAYGDAQRRLGGMITSADKPEYISKFVLSAGPVDAESIYLQTLRDLKTDHLAALMFHSVADLRDARAEVAWNCMRQARDGGVVGMIGASIYDESDLDALLHFAPDVDILQLPGNILDRRLVEHPKVERLRARGCKVHVRSVYLQGMLLVEPARISDGMAPLRDAVASLRSLAARSSMSTVEVALGYVRDHPSVDAVVVGALNESDLSETIRAWSGVSSVGDYQPPKVHASMLDPRHWPIDAVR